jgi:hypothetical protein
MSKDFNETVPQRIRFSLVRLAAGTNDEPHAPAGCLGKVAEEPLVHAALLHARHGPVKTQTTKARNQTKRNNLN